ncbi:unnamed protein product [Diamesa serratosioi]
MTFNINMTDVLSEDILKQLTKANDENLVELEMKKIHFEDHLIIVFNTLLKSKLQEVADIKPKHRKILIVKKKKEKIVLPEDLLEKVEVLKMSNLCFSFKGKTMEEFFEHCQLEMHDESLYEIANTLTLEQSKGTVFVSQIRIVFNRYYISVDIWHDLRIGRITASRLHETSRCKSTTGVLATKFLGDRGGFSFAMMRGTVLEEHVFNEIQKEYPGLRQAGTVINPQIHPFVSASPDGIHDDFVLEIKCPLNDKTHATHIDLTKLSKKYIGQIQLQMHLTKKNIALLAVAAVDFETTRSITKLWIPYDKEYIENLIEEAVEFYKLAIFPKLIDRFGKKSAKISTSTKRPPPKRSRKN